MVDEQFVPARREDDRQLERRRAHCRIVDKTWSGTIHDRSDAGAFFQPEECLTDGEVIDPEDAWMVARVGDSVELLVEDERRSQAGQVRWTGCSDVHHCGGLGLLLKAA